MALFLVLVPVLLLLGRVEAQAGSESLCEQVSSAAYVPGTNLTTSDKQTLAFPLNLEYLETEFFSFCAFGYGLDKINPHLADGGPAPKGAQIAHLDDLVRDIIAQFALQEVGHVRAIKETVKEEGFPRPLLDLSKENFATLMDKAFDKPLNPPFDPYANSLNCMLASYVVPYVGLTGYVGSAPLLQGPKGKELGARLLGVESGQDAVIRTYLYTRKHERVSPYTYTVAEFTNRISILRNRLDDATGVSDEGLTVPKCLGAEGVVQGNILAGDKNSLAYARTPAQVLEVVYSTGNPSEPGGFYPQGAKGVVAESFLKRKSKNENIFC